MQQVWFLLMCLSVSVVYATLGNTDNRVWSMLKQAGRYTGATVAVLVGLAWVLYWISS